MFQHVVYCDLCRRPTLRTTRKELAHKGYGHAWVCRECYQAHLAACARCRWQSLFQEAGTHSVPRV